MASAGFPATRGEMTQTQGRGATPTPSTPKSIKHRYDTTKVDIIYFIRRYKVSNINGLEHTGGYNALER